MFFQQSANMLILSLKSGISTWESMGTESLLNPLVELQLLEAFWTCLCYEQNIFFIYFKEDPAY